MGSTPASLQFCEAWKEGGCSGSSDYHTTHYRSLTRICRWERWRRSYSHGSSTTRTPLRCPTSISELLNTNQLTRGFRHHCWYRPHTRQMGGLSCYTMCTSPKHAAPAAQALRRGSVTSRCGAHRRQETVHRLGSNSKVPRVRKLLLPPPLRVSGGDSLLDYPRGLLCDELCFFRELQSGHHRM